MVDFCLRNSIGVHGIKTYLTFDGNCRQAMLFYKNSLGGELLMQTLGDCAGGEEMPDAMRGMILRATLYTSGLEIVATDLAPEEGLLKGNNISLLLECESLSEIMERYRMLSCNSRFSEAVRPANWGGYFATVTDQFGLHWILNFNPD